MTAAHKTESENEDRPGKGVQVISVQAEGGWNCDFKGTNHTVMSGHAEATRGTISDNPGQLGNRNNENRNMNQVRGNDSGQNSCKNAITVR